MMEESRKQFDEWWCSAARGLTIINFDVQRELQWAAWQASRAAIEIELPEVCSCCYNESEKEWHDSVMGEISDNLRAAGLKVKGE